MTVTCDDCGREFDAFDLHTVRDVLDEVPDRLQADAILQAFCGGCSDGTARVVIDKRLLDTDTDSDE